MCLHFRRLRSVFLTGFALGFLFALLFSLAQYIIPSTSCCESQGQYGDSVKSAYPELSGPDKADEEIILQCWKWNKTNKEDITDTTYRTWLKHNYLGTHKLNLDEHLYGFKEKKGQGGINQLIEADWLRTNVHITCVVFVKKLRLAKAAKDTWGKRCNRIYFFGQNLMDADVPVLRVQPKLKSSWQLLCEAMNHVSRNGDTVEWIIFVKDDTVVIPENLRYILAPFSYTQDYYLGHAITMWGQAYNAAQAGYVLSRSALEKVVNMFNSSEKCLTGGKYWKKEDYYLAKHLASLDIHPLDTRDQYLRGTFHGYSLQNLLWGVVRPGSYFTHALYPPQEKCCSPMSVTFSAGEADKMYTLDYLLYHFKVLRRKAVYGARRAPTPVPEEDVWRIVLREEFNITHLGEISSETYYEIWHSKYSEPEQLIGQNYQSMPDVLSSVLTAYELESKSLDKSGTN